MTENHGKVWWSELMTRDPEAAKKYYADTCGWEFDEMPNVDGGIYLIGMAHGKPTAGILDMTGVPHLDGIPPHWFTYFAVDDVDGAVASSKAMGGSIRRDLFDIPGVGRIAIVEDPTGAVMGLMTPAS